ncbi:MAG TPA: hypothetical protein VGL88_11740 [Pseudonocardiaceae bacterium]|jgi:hypothetical protein
MTSAVIGSVMISLILGFVAGWVTGWAARGEGNRQWRESFDRKLYAARARVVEAEAQTAEAVAAADHAYAWAERVSAPVAPAVVHVHMAQPLPYGTAGAIAEAAVPALIAGQVRDG